MLTHLSLGSNIGDRQDNLRRAIDELRHAGVLERISSMYETEPADMPDQPWFLNCAAAVRTSLAPLALLHLLQGIERDLGRMREIPKGPRTIDLDILLCEDLIMDTLELTIPHPQFAQRRFVLEPLAEIAPDVRHPRTGRTVIEMLNALEDPLLVRKAS